MSLRILWVLPYLPWPTSSGGKTRQFHLLRALAQAGHGITLLVQSKTELDDAARQALEPLLEQLIVLPRRSLRSPTTLLAVMASPLPMLASINGYAPKLSRCFVDLLSQSWDVVQIEHSYSFQPYEQASFSLSTMLSPRWVGRFMIASRPGSGLWCGSTSGAIAAGNGM